jgi:hypothetical protein
MLTLVNILILFFLFLILYQIFLANNIFAVNQSLIEGLDNQYQQYDTNNPNNALILAQQNAGNIEYLKERMDDIQDMSQQFQDLSGNVASLQTQVNGLVQAQQDYSNQMTGGSAPEITGTTDTTTTDTTTTDTTTTDTNT